MFSHCLQENVLLFFVINNNLFCFSDIFYDEGNCFNNSSSSVSKNQQIVMNSYQKSFQCTLCPYSTSNSAHLKIHFRSHTGEKPYKCNHCFKRFIQKNNLTRHERIHTGEKPYECLYCFKKFSRKSHLKTHIFIHKKKKIL